MFNLLPREEREVLRAEYRARQYTVYAAAAALLGILSVGLLMPSYITYITSHLLLRSEQRMIRAAEPTEEKDTRQLVARGNAIAKQVRAFEPILHTPTLTTLLSRVVPGVRITSIAMITGADKRIQVSVDGTASTREALRSFDASLQRDGAFTGVDVPLSSYTRDTNIPFSITFFASR